MFARLIFQRRILEQLLLKILKGKNSLRGCIHRVPFVFTELSKSTNGQTHITKADTAVKWDACVMFEKHKHRRRQHLKVIGFDKK